MIRPDGKEDLKLIDFGMARVLEPGKTVKVACGTPEFVGESASCEIKDPFTTPEKFDNVVYFYVKTYRSQQSIAKTEIFINALQTVGN